MELPPAQRRLLSILALDGAVLSPAALEERFWPDGPPRTARTALQVHVSRVRAIAPGAIETVGDGYRLAPTVEVDAHEYLNLANRAADLARHRRWEESLETLAAAEQHWVDTPFDDLASDGFASGATSRLEEARAWILQLHAEALLALGRAREAVPLLAKHSADRPLDEDLHGNLMLALYRTGRQADAVRTFQRISQHLSGLGLIPGPELRRLEERILLRDPSLGSQGAGDPPHNLPAQPTTFVGRQVELDLVTKALEERRLVTLTGGPGFGKTRFAVELGHRVLDRYADGVWLIELANAADADDVATAVASVMRSPGRDGLRALARDLADRDVLVILDNCEHVAAACAELMEGLGDAGGRLRLLATSRAPLGGRTERVWPLRPLETPTSPDIDNPADLLGLSSVQLYVDRIGALDPSFSVTPELVPRLADVAMRLAGIPLAIELAARWGSTLNLDDVAALLAAPDEVTPTTDSAHTSLATALGWSISSLAEEDRHLAGRLTVFRGSFGLGDAHPIVGDGRTRTSVAASVSRIVDASLLNSERDGHGAIRYRMLPPIRETLASGRDLAEEQAAHARHYLALASDLQDDPFGGVVSLDSVDDDVEDIRHAIETGLAKGWNGLVANALVPLSSYLHQRYRAQESLTLLERVLARPLEVTERAHAMRALGSAQELLGRLDDATETFTTAISLFGSVDDPTGRARCLLSLAGVESRRGDWVAGHAHAAEALALVGDERTSASSTAHYYMGECLADSGKFDAAVPLLSAAAAGFKGTGEAGRASYALTKLANAATLAGDRRLASRALTEALDLAQRSGSGFRLAKADSAKALAEAFAGRTNESARTLQSLNERIEPLRPDPLTDVVLPALAVLARIEDWERVAECAAALPRLMLESGLAVPVPWQHQLARWAEVAEDQLGDAFPAVVRRAAMATRATLLDLVDVGLTPLVS
ncbi:MAG: hypothetical protein HKN46_10945 [Acidimicrobiia bacterium]|nr:hypothetical protein [Acidimicrobiia bacterium]